MVFRPRSAACVVDRRRDAVGGEDHRPALGHLVELLDEDRAARLEVGHHVLVVHDLLADVDRGAVEVERLLDRDHGAVDAGAVAAGRREQDVLGGLGVEDRRKAEVGAHGPESTGVSAPSPILAACPHSAMPRPSRRPRCGPSPTPSAQWIDKLGGVWVEGQIAQVNRRPGMQTVFMTLRDTVADISVTLTCSRSLVDSMNPPLVEGASVVVHARPSFYANRGSFSLDCPRDPHGRSRRAARPASSGAASCSPPRACSPPSSSATCRSSPAGSAWSPRPTAPPSATSSTMRAAVGPRCSSRWPTPPCRAPARRAR